MRRWLRVALALVLLSLVGGVTVKRGPGGGAGDVITVDVAGSSNPCALVQAELDEFNVNDENVTLVVTGETTIDFSDLTDQGNYRTCMLVGQSDDTKDTGSKGLLTLDFESASITYNSTGQTEGAVILQLGARYNDPLGNTGSVANSVKISGYLRVLMTVNNDGSFAAGDVPMLPFGGTFPATGTIGMLASEFVYNDLSAFSMLVHGITGNRDRDDVGFYFQQDFGTKFGEMHAQAMGVGMIVEGAMGGFEGVASMSANDVGMVFGNKYIPDTFKLDDGTVVSELTREGTYHGLSQGNAYGQLIIFTGSRMTFSHVYFEEAVSMSRHSIMLMAGVCSADATDICAVDADCAAGTCDSVGGTAMTRVLFEGSRGLQTDSVANDDGIVLGPNFVRNATTFEASVILDGLQNTSSTRLIRTYNPLATGIIAATSQAFNSRLVGYPWFAAPRFRLDMDANTLTIGRNYFFMVHTFTNAANASNRTITLSEIDESMPPIRYCDTGGAGELSIDPDTGATRSIVFPGLAPAAGATITSDTTVPSCVTLIPMSATQWLATDFNGTWTTP